MRELMTAQKSTQIMGRARLWLSLHLGTPMRKFTWCKLRKSRGYITSFLGGAWRSAWRRREGTSNGKVRLGLAQFFFTCATVIRMSCAASAIWRECLDSFGKDCIFTFTVSCTFVKWTRCSSCWWINSGQIDAYENRTGAVIILDFCLLWRIVQIILEWYLSFYYELFIL